MANCNNFSLNAIAGDILILGDGNLSFSACLAKKRCQNSRLFCTVFESEAEFMARYSFGTKNMELLRNIPGVTVLFCVDATKLLTNQVLLSIKFDTVIMNFPHFGGKTNLRKSRLLLREIFNGVKSALKLDGLFYLTLAGGQSGLPQIDDLTVKSDDKNDHLLNSNNKDSVEQGSRKLPNHKKDSWQAIYLAAYYGFVLETQNRFNPVDFPDYNCTGYLNKNRAFHLRDAETLIFKLAPEITTSVTALFDSGICSIHQKEMDNFGLIHQLRPYYLHDVSFWILDENVSKEWIEDKLIKSVAKFSNGLIKDVWPLPNFTYFCSEKQRESRVYRLLWQAHFGALTRECCRDLQNLLRQKIVDSFCENSEMPLMLR